MVAEVETRAAGLRAELAASLAAAGVLDDDGWRKAVTTVPRHRFVPGFYLPRAGDDEPGLTVWEPVTAGTDPGPGVQQGLVTWTALRSALRVVRMASPSAR